jgi:hypothetical protein
VEHAISFTQGAYKHEQFVLQLPQPNTDKPLSDAGLVKFQVLSLVRALFLASFSYFGYNRLGYITEEVVNPMR